MANSCGSAVMPVRLVYCATTSAGVGPANTNRSTMPPSAIHCVLVPWLPLCTSTNISAAFSLRARQGQCQWPCASGRVPVAVCQWLCASGRVACVLVSERCLQSAGASTARGRACWPGIAHAFQRGQNRTGVRWLLEARLNPRAHALLIIAQNNSRVI